MTYSTLQTLGVTSDFDYMNDKLYWIESTVVKEYNMNTDTLTSISDGSSFDTGDLIASGRGPLRPFCFNNGVYIVSDNDASIKVWKWVSGTTWTKVLDYDFTIWSDGGAHFIVTFTRTDTQLIFSGIDPGSFSNYVVKYSNNGTSWSNGSVSWSSSPTTFTPQTYYPVRLVTDMAEGSTDALAFGLAAEEVSPFGVMLVMMRWNNVSSWVEIASGEADYDYTGATPAWLWAWYGNMSTPWPARGWRDKLIWYSQQDYEHASYPTGSQNNPTDTNYYAVHSFNWSGAGKLGFGVRYSGSDLYVAPLGTDEEWETAVEELISNKNDLRYGVRRSDGTSFVVVWNNPRTVNVIMSGTTSFPDSSFATGFARLYWGLNNLLGSKELRVG